MLTGIKAIDDDHRDLIAQVNAIAELERVADKAALSAALADFKADLARHFEMEITHLRTERFPEVDAHAKHHDEMLAALDRLIHDIAAGGKSAGGEVARSCYHELVTVVLMKDMQFVNWLADRGRR